MGWYGLRIANMLLQSRFIRILLVASLVNGIGCRQEKSLTGDKPTSENAGPKSIPSTRGNYPQQPPREFQTGDWFEDVTKTTGVDFTYETGREAQLNTILETVGGGVGLVDFDRDSYVDLFAVGGGKIDSQTGVPSGVPSRLYRNLSNWKFVDISDSSIIPEDTDYAHGCLTGDFDSDGFPDLLLTCYGKCILLLNAGDGTFIDASQNAGIKDESWHTGAACGDVNGDGFLDIYIANYVDWQPNPDEVCNQNSRSLPDVCPPQRYSAVTDRLYINLGDGQFQDIATKAGLTATGKGLGVVANDLNNDGLCDFYVANDEVRNELLLGSRTFPLSEIGEVSGTAYNASGSPEGSMGVDTADINGDGLPDLWVTNYELEDNSLYLNIGEGSFQYATAQFGLAGSSRENVGFGTAFHDFDSDGWADFYLLNGHVRYHSEVSPYEQPAFLYKNRNGKRFEAVGKSAGSYFAVPHSARGGASADIDNDGAADLVIGSLDEPITLLRNRNRAENWLRVQLCGTESARESVGASIIVNTFGRNTTYFKKSGAGYLSQSDPRLLIPFESTREDIDVRVKWTSGTIERFENLTCQQDHLLVEGKGEALISKSE